MKVPQPPPDDLEALIREARQRARRRRLLYLAAALAVGLALGIELGGGAGGRHAAPARPARPPASGAQELQRIESVARRATIGEAGLVAPRVGWAMNGLGLWWTQDGGRKWRTITPPPILATGDVVARVVDIAFVDPLHGWISASDIRSSVVLADGSVRHLEIERTTDGGRTWRSSIPPGCALCGGTYLSFLDADHGYALTALQAEPRLYRTADGGKNWRLVARAPFGGPFVFVGRSRGFGGRGGTLYRTADAGRTWSRVRPRWAPKPPALWDLDFTSRSNGWAVFATPAGAALVRTTDGGRNWTPLAPPFPKLPAPHPRPVCGSACKRP